MKMSCGEAPYLTALLVAIGATAIGSNVILFPEIDRTIVAVSALRRKRLTPDATLTLAFAVSVTVLGETLVLTDCTTPIIVPVSVDSWSFATSGVVAVTCPVAEEVEKPVPAVEPPSRAKLIPVPTVRSVTFESVQLVVVPALAVLE